MSTKRISKPVRLRVLHDCTTHAPRWGEFDTTGTYRFDNGGERHVMTRCDGSVMEVWDGEDGVEVVAS